MNYFLNSGESEDTEAAIAKNYMAEKDDMIDLDCGRFILTGTKEQWQEFLFPDAEASLLKQFCIPESIMCAEKTEITYAEMMAVWEKLFPQPEEADTPVVVERQP